MVETFLESKLWLKTIVYSSYGELFEKFRKFAIIQNIIWAYFGTES
jgi:hypothetical protein